jgi:hypothetical protein
MGSAPTAREIPPRALARNVTSGLSVVEGQPRDAPLDPFRPQSERQNMKLLESIAHRDTNSDCVYYEHIFLIVRHPQA